MIFTVIPTNDCLNQKCKLLSKLSQSKAFLEISEKSTPTIDQSSLNMSTKMPHAPRSWKIVVSSFLFTSSFWDQTMKWFFYIKFQSNCQNSISKSNCLKNQLIVKTNTIYKYKPPKSINLKTNPTKNQKLNSNNSTPISRTLYDFSYHSRLWCFHDIYNPSKTVK